MELDKNSVEKLIICVENYSKTSIELMTLRLVDKTSHILSKLIFYFILIVVCSFFLGMLSIGVAYKIGHVLGADYYGFLIVAAFFALLGILLLMVFTRVVSKIKNTIISLLLN